MDHLAFIWLSDETSEVGKNSTFVIVSTYFNIKKQYGVFTLSLTSESNVFTLTTWIISEFFNAAFRVKN